MTKCVTCHGTLQKHETTCFLCGTDVTPDKSKAVMQARFASVVKFGMIFSAAMAALALFTDIGPSFPKCMVTTIVLGLVLKSARMMQENA